jgi:SAM-dependent methyltransferase
MRQEDIWDHEAALRYDTPGTGVFAPEVLGPAVDRLAGLAEDGRALEFAIGTGRVAVPLAQRGVPVTGIELSPPMIEQLRTKADETAIPVIAGDMATSRAPGVYTLVYLVYNGISALLTQGGQVACFRNAARHPLRPRLVRPALAKSQDPPGQRGNRPGGPVAGTRLL